MRTTGTASGVVTLAPAPSAPWMWIVTEPIDGGVWTWAPAPAAPPPCWAGAIAGVGAVSIGAFAADAFG